MIWGDTIIRQQLLVKLPPTQTPNSASLVSPASLRALFLWTLTRFSENSKNFASYCCTLQLVQWVLSDLWHSLCTTLHLRKTVKECLQHVGFCTLSKSCFPQDGPGNTVALELLALTPEGHKLLWDILPTSSPQRNLSHSLDGRLSILTWSVAFQNWHHHGGWSRDSFCKRPSTQLRFLHGESGHEQSFDRNSCCRMSHTINKFVWLAAMMNWSNVEPKFKAVWV